LFAGFACAIGMPVRVIDTVRGLEYKDLQGEWVRLADDAKGSASVEAYMAKSLSRIIGDLQIQPRSYLDFKILGTANDILEALAVQLEHVPSAVRDVENFEEWSTRVIDDAVYARSATWRIKCEGTNPQRLRNARMGYLREVGPGYAVMDGNGSILCNKDPVAQAITEMAQAYAACKVKGFSAPKINSRPARSASVASDGPVRSGGAGARKGAERDWTSDPDYNSKEHFVKMFEAKLHEIKLLMSLNCVSNPKYQTEYSEIYAYGEACGFTRGQRSALLPYMCGTAAEVAGALWDRAYDHLNFTDDALGLYKASAAMLRILQGQIILEGTRFLLRTRTELPLSYVPDRHAGPNRYQSRGGNAGPQRGGGGGYGGGRGSPPARSGNRD